MQNDNKKTVYDKSLFCYIEGSLNKIYLMKGFYSISFDNHTNSRVLRKVIRTAKHINCALISLLRSVPGEWEEEIRCLKLGH